MQYVIPPIKKKYFTPTKYAPKNTKYNLYEVQTTKCTKTLYQTDTIRPLLVLAVEEFSVYTIIL